MFEDLYDALSMLWSWRWPEAVGEIMAVEVEQFRRMLDSRDRWRLAIAYKFHVGGDGPYCGEGFWVPRVLSKRRVVAAHRNFHEHQHVPVRYRPDDPTVNRIDR